jgi:ABC-2 type transport system permease protein
LRLRELAYSVRANRTLVMHELRNVVSGRAFWATMLALTFLVGYSFIQAVDLYSQASKSALEFPELARGMVPFEGILVPTLGALYLASTLLLPFIAIRAIAQDKETGALKLLLQMPLTPAWLVTIKVAAVAIAIIALFLPGLSFIPIWLYLGGHVHTPEFLNLLAGHALYALDVVGIAFFAAALSDSLSTAAIFALSFTLAFWVMDFAATASGGFLHRLSFYSLTAALHQFEQGLFSLSTVLAMILGAIGLFALTATWLPTGIAVRKKLLVSSVIILLFSIATFGLSRARVYIDVTENRRNSFNPADEVALRKMQSPLLLRIYLSPEDSRLKEMEANVLGKLRRTVPRLEVHYEDTTGHSLFTSVPDERYGLIIFQYEGQRAESRSNSAREILPLLHELSGVTVKPEKEPDYRGYPLVADAVGYGVWFYGILPVLILFSWWRVWRIGTLSPNRGRRRYFDVYSTKF